MKKIDITEYIIETDKFSKDFSGFKFVMLSDLHSNEYKINLHQINRMIKEEKPDAVLIAGDMFNGKVRDDVTEVMNFLTALAKRYQIFYALGNHEYRMKIYPDTYGGRFDSIYGYLADAGVCFLEDETVYIEKESEMLALSGVEIDSVFYKFRPPVMGKGIMDSHLGDADKSKFNLLLAHNPDYFKNYARWGADLTLSGHVHGGIVRIPGIGGIISTTKKILPQYDEGLYETKSGKKMIIGRGLGAHTVKLRINNRPELVIVKILAKK